jgi:aspartyl/glutamyl-tRNA(Asn/Gln) amidotransferase C subunit
MERVPFGKDEIAILRQAIDLSEELISDSYKVSTSEWKRYRYDIQSLKDLRDDEICDIAFAQILRYQRSPLLRARASEPGDYFKICLQDHVIRNALARDRHIEMLPLVTYIVSHELIHVVRFARFLHRFHSTASEGQAEEMRVHELTELLLKGLNIKGLPEVLEAFRHCRTMETFLEPEGTGGQSAVEDPLAPICRHNGRKDHYPLREDCQPMREKITLEEVRHVARLGRLELAPEEERRLTAQMNDILTYMDKLNELDTSRVAPTTHAIRIENVFRDDQTHPSIDRELALDNAPQSDGVNFIVPKVI